MRIKMRRLDNYGMLPGLGSGGEFYETLDRKIGEPVT